MPVYNRRETTLQGLRSLSRIEKNDFEIRIFVVDDNSSDGTVQAIRENFPNVQIIRGDGNLHYAGGTNRGIEKALEWNADYIAAMNDDSIFHERFLLKLVETAEKNPRSIVGALLLLWNEPHRVFQVGQTWQTLRGGWVIPQNLNAFDVPKKAFDVECIVGNCVLFPAKAIRENGLMDEKKFPHGWGDAQYLTRMRKAGWRLLIEPKSLVWCEPNTYPLPLHQVSNLKKLRELLFNRRHPLNLQRQFIARWESAPGRIKGLASFAVYLFQICGKSVKYGLKSFSRAFRLKIFRSEI